MLNKKLVTHPSSHSRASCCW